VKKRSFWLPTEESGEVIQIKDHETDSSLPSVTQNAKKKGALGTTKEGVPPRVLAQAITSS
jgi:hypothetical protein